MMCWKCEMQEIRRPREAHNESIVYDKLSESSVFIRPRFRHIQHRVNPASRYGVAFDELLDFQQRHGERLTR